MVIRNLKKKTVFIVVRWKDIFIQWHVVLQELYCGAYNKWNTF
jgi:hypothetical protein